jgi:endo-1,4-beta-D-glucanase Y
MSRVDVLLSRRAGKLSLTIALALSSACIPKNAGPIAPVPLSSHEPIAKAKPYRCGNLLEQDETIARKILSRAYESWRRLYVTGEGARGALRVRRPEDKDDSVSEGIAYGMLIAAYHGDRAIFDGLFSYARARFDGNGLMHWRVNAEGRVIGSGAATDADEDMAVALIVADKLWGTPYGDFARKTIDSIYQHEVEAGSFVLKPGDIWGGTDVTNPSYFAPAYYKVFAEYTGNKQWLNVADKCYRMLALVGTHNRGTGLIPDWMNAGAGPAKGQSYDYKWDAARVPLRLAHDAAWFCDPRATTLLRSFNDFFRQQGPLMIGDGYKLSGEKFSSIHAAAFVGPVAASSLFSSDEVFRKTLWADLVKRWGDGYYSNHLRHLSILFVTGLFPNPLEMDLAKAEAIANASAPSSPTTSPVTAAAPEPSSPATLLPATPTTPSAEPSDAALAPLPAPTTATSATQPAVIP